MIVAEWTDTYGIHHWRILRNSYRKLAWVWFEPTTTEFHSDALTDWAIRPWFQRALRANFVQLFQFHVFVQCSAFISVIAFVSRHICFKRNLAQVIIWVQRKNLISKKWINKNLIGSNASNWFCCKVPSPNYGKCSYEFLDGCYLLLVLP